MGFDGRVVDGVLGGVPQWPSTGLVDGTPVAGHEPRSHHGGMRQFGPLGAANLVPEGSFGASSLTYGSS